MTDEYQVGEVVRIPTLWAASRWPELQQIVDDKKGPVVDDIVKNWQNPDEDSRINPIQQL